MVTQLTGKSAISSTSEDLQTILPAIKPNEALEMGWGHRLLDNSLLGAGINNAGRGVVFHLKRVLVEVKKIPEDQMQKYTWKTHWCTLLLVCQKMGPYAKYGPGVY